MRPLRLLYTCPAVGGRMGATQAQWISALAGDPRIEGLWVCTRSIDRGLTLPSNVDAVAVGAGTLRQPFGVAAALRSWRKVEFDAIVVSQGGGPFPLYLYPSKLLRRIPMFQWRAHPVVSWRRSFYSTRLVDLTLTASPASFSLPGAQVDVIGHAIDTARFAPTPAVPSHQLLHVSRVTPIKRVDRVLSLLAHVRDTSGRRIGLTVVGSGTEGAHGDSLRRLANSLGIADQVEFRPHVPHQLLPELLAEYSVKVNLGETALDKSDLESLAVGQPVLTSNPCTSEILGPDERRLMVVSATDQADQAEKLLRLLDLSPADRAALSSRLRAAVEPAHSLDTFPARLLGAMARSGLLPASTGG